MPGLSYYDTEMVALRENGMMLWDFDSAFFFARHPVGMRVA